MKKPGLNLLSRSDSAAILKLHAVEVKDDKLFFYVEQRTGMVGVEQSPFFWRGFFLINQKLISLTASSFVYNSKSKKRLKRLIEEFADKIIISNS